VKTVYEKKLYLVEHYFFSFQFHFIHGLKNISKQNQDFKAWRFELLYNFTNWLTKTDLAFNVKIHFKEFSTYHPPVPTHSL